MAEQDGQENPQPLSRKDRVERLIRLIGEGDTLANEIREANEADRGVDTSVYERIDYLANEINKASKKDYDEAIMRHWERLPKKQIGRAQVPPRSSSPAKGK